MKTNRFIAIATLILIAFVINIQFVYAEPVSDGESDATIEFEPGNEVTPPVCPDPDDQDCDPGGGTENPGPLSIDHVSNFTFETVKISNQTTSYPTTTTQPYLQVTDLRGNGAGWHVKASMSPFTTGENENQEVGLLGAKLVLSNGSAFSYNANLLPSAPTINQTINLTSDNALVQIVTAEEGTGKATWVHRWFPTSSNAESSAELVVLVGTAEANKQYKATITWNLHDTP